MVGVVGKDFGNNYLEMFERHGIDTSGIEKAEGKTFHWRGRYRENFKERDTLETCLNVFEDFNPVIPDEFKSARFVFLGNIDPKLQSRVLDQAAKAEFVGMDTMNFWIQNSLDDLHSVLERVDILFINDEEAIELSRENSILKAAGAIREMGPKYLVIKRGEFGAILFGADLKIFVPALLLPDVVDPTGAGDTFAGGFLGSMCASGGIALNSLAESLMAGTVMASFSVEDFSVGGLENLATDNIYKRLQELRSMTRY